jgi:hypothetical protein
VRVETFRLDGYGSFGGKGAEEYVTVSRFRKACIWAWTRRQSLDIKNEFWERSRMDDLHIIIFPSVMDDSPLPPIWILIQIQTRLNEIGQVYSIMQPCVLLLGQLF